MGRRFLVLALGVAILAAAAAGVLVLTKNEKLAGTFRGFSVGAVPEQDGFVRVPTPEEDSRGVVLIAFLEAKALERISGTKSVNPLGMQLTMDSIDLTQTDCTADGWPPIGAPFAVEAKCASARHTRSKAAGKGDLFILPDQKLIVYGGKPDLAMLYVDTLVAKFIHPQLSGENFVLVSCQVRAMIGYVLIQPITTCGGGG
jgi:hypothetical protein